tara:strand:+ start:46 stop:201 length:156 start_codon:yes stop_codon:yes gene_type:complete
LEIKLQNLIQQAAVAVQVLQAAAVHPVLDTDTKKTLKRAFFGGSFFAIFWY